MPTKRNTAALKQQLPLPPWVQQRPDILKLREEVMKLTPFERKFVAGLNSGWKGRPKGINDAKKRKRRTQAELVSDAKRRATAMNDVFDIDGLLNLNTFGASQLAADTLASLGAEPVAPFENTFQNDEGDASQLAADTLASLGADPVAPFTVQNNNGDEPLVCV